MNNIIVRIVRLHLKIEERDNFLNLFEANKVAIRNFPGCSHLELLTDVNDPGVIATLSHWEKQDDLESYRQSPLFRSVWQKVKPMFSGKPIAFTYSRIMRVDQEIPS